MTRVMIAIDGSDLDARLAEAAHDLFGPDAEYWAVNVRNPGATAPPVAEHGVPTMYSGAVLGYGIAYPFTPPRPYEAPVGDPDADDDLEAARQQAARAMAESAGVDADAVIAESGDPPTAILGAAHRHEADVIVVGNRDRSWWSKLVEPSVSSDVIEGSPVPVLVISEAS